MTTTWNLNAQRGGVEVRFSERPPGPTLDRLKAAGWRWSKFARCWWHKDCPEARELAGQVAGGAASCGTCGGAGTVNGGRSCQACDGTGAVLVQPAQASPETSSPARSFTRAGRGRFVIHEEHEGAAAALRINQNPRGRCEDAPCCGCCD